MKRINKALMVLLAACVIAAITFFVVQGTSSPVATRPLYTVSAGSASIASTSPVAGASSANRENTSALSADRGSRHNSGSNLIGGLPGMLGNLVLFSVVAMGVINMRKRLQRRAARATVRS